VADLLPIVYDHDRNSAESAARRVVDLGSERLSARLEDSGFDDDPLF
jgi:hypothetical protein